MICRLDILFDIGYDNEALLSEVVTSGAHHINSAPGNGAAVCTQVRWVAFRGKQGINHDY